jgi:hypothetical protein
VKQTNIPSATQIIAFAVVELNTPLPYEVLCEMSPNDPLYISLLDAWKKREERLDRRTGLLAAVIANCMGGGKKKYEPSDFMPKEPKSVKDSESEIKSQFLRYTASQKSK